MRTKSRLAKLEAVVSSLSPASNGIDLDEELARWRAALKKVVKLVRYGSAAEAVARWLSEKWPILESKPAASCPVEAVASRCDETRRAPDALLAIVRTIPAEMVPVAVTAESLSGQNPWLHNWLMSVCRLTSRVPADLTIEATCRLVRVYTDPTIELDTFTRTCDQCGLFRPHPRLKYPAAPDPLPSCPHCDCDKWTWTQRTDESSHPWRDLAKAELDPDK